MNLFSASFEQVLSRRRTSSQQAENKFSVSGELVQNLRRCASPSKGFRKTLISHPFLVVNLQYSDFGLFSLEVILGRGFGHFAHLKGNCGG